MEDSDYVLSLWLAIILVLPVAISAFGINPQIVWIPILLYVVIVALLASKAILRSRTQPKYGVIGRIRAWMYLLGIPVAVLGNSIPYFLGYSSQLTFAPFWVVFGMMPFYAVMTVLSRSLPGKLYPEFLANLSKVQQTWVSDIMKNTAASAFSISGLIIASILLVVFREFTAFIPLGLLLTALLVAYIAYRERGIERQVKKFIASLGRRGNELIAISSVPRLSSRTQFAVLFFITISIAFSVLLFAAQIVIEIQVLPSAQLADVAYELGSLSGFLTVGVMWLSVFFSLKGYRVQAILFMASAVLMLVSTWSSFQSVSALRLQHATAQVLWQPITFLLDGPVYIGLMSILVPWLIATSGGRTQPGKQKPPPTHRKPD